MSSEQEAIVVGNESLHIAVDIGGTFTDCVLQGERGFRFVSKALTTKADPSIGVMDCLASAASRLGVPVSRLLERTVSFVHGTTVGTNALTERRGVRTGLLMTKGHEQAITIGRVRQKVTGLSEREKIHVTHLAKATPPIVAPEFIKPVTERLDKNGKIVVPLDLASAERAVDELVEREIQALAICLLWSFVNPAHEHQIGALVRKKHPQLFVSLSSEIAPRLGEYERCVSTVFNSYIGPIVGSYVATLDRRLKEQGMKCDLLVMQSNGGLTTVSAVAGRPLLTVDSGPAGGVLGARFLSELIDQKQMICADVGGTTFDVGIVAKDRTETDPAPVIDRYSYLVPKIFVKSIGAGGGSIAWIDDGGSLRVGPQSAGANPGPAAYGTGGTDATVTDAHVALGYLTPEFPLGGTVQVRKDLSEEALSRLGKRLAMETIEVAAGILSISNAQMADLIRKVTVERGLDPRKFALLVYGGAGPVFAAFLAKEIGTTLAYIPSESGVFSALGMLTTDIKLQEESSVSYRLPIEGSDLEELNRQFNALDEKVRKRFQLAGLGSGRVELVRSVDMRFGMQVHELEVGAPARDLSLEDARRLGEDFPSLYEATYGKNSAYTAAGIDLVTLRSSGIIPMTRPDLRAGEARASRASLIGERMAYFPSAGGFVATAVHSGEHLATDQRIEGPAIIQRFADTVVIPPHAHAVVDRFGGIALTVE
ncbi:MAG: hydantoinase/oxoprolinase family protein [Betaproteobacteria bacterium]|nr:MAG: hydantoinase/oxoprolinase family protein [Betaproteobacteria bacterium]